MALRTRYAGSGLGLKPISIGEEPYAADSDFDSTVRIPTAPRQAGRIAAPSITATPTATVQAPQPAPIAPQPQAQPPQPIAPPSVTAPPTGYDPTQLNYEGTTFDERPEQGPVSKRGPNDFSPEELAYLKANLKLNTDQMYNLLEAYQAGDYRIIDSNLYGTEDSPEWRKTQQALFASLEKLGTPLTKRGETDYQVHYLQRQVFNQALDRLKQAGAAGAREQDEELMAMLASRGLLDSGIAAREISRLQETRNRNLYEAANQLNQMILSGEITRLTARDLATLEADLQKRNQEALLRLQQRFAEQNQPNAIAQTIGTVVGTAIPFLGSKAPDRGAQLYGEEDPGYRNA